MATVEAGNAFAGHGAVVLDIGGDVGALIVDMPAALVGVEIEIRSAPEHPSRYSDHDHDHTSDHDNPHTHRPHVAVVLRPTADGLAPSAVFGELLEGDYELYERQSGAPVVQLRASVRGGGVTYASWPAGSGSG